MLLSALTHDGFKDNNTNTTFQFSVAHGNTCRVVPSGAAFQQHRPQHLGLCKGVKIVVHWGRQVHTNPYKSTRRLKKAAPGNATCYEPRAKAGGHQSDTNIRQVCRDTNVHGLGHKAITRTLIGQEKGGKGNERLHRLFCQNTNYLGISLAHALTTVDCHSRLPAPP